MGKCVPPGNLTPRDQRQRRDEWRTDGRVTPSLVSDGRRAEGNGRQGTGEGAAAATVHKLIFGETCLYGTRDAGR